MYDCSDSHTSELAKVARKEIAFPLWRATELALKEETAFPRCRATDSRWNKKPVYLGSSVTC